MIFTNYFTRFAILLGSYFDEVLLALGYRWKPNSQRPCSHIALPNLNIYNRFENYPSLILNNCLGTCLNYHLNFLKSKERLLVHFFTFNISFLKLTILYCFDICKTRKFCKVTEFNLFHVKDLLILTYEYKTFISNAFPRTKTTFTILDLIQSEELWEETKNTYKTKIKVRGQ